MIISYNKDGHDLNDVRRSYFTSRNKVDEKGVLSHITQSSSGDIILFPHQSDYQKMHDLLEETSHEFNLSVLAYAFVPQKVHLLIQQNVDNLSLAMKNLFSRYAKYFNFKYQRKGHLFSGRFKQSLCADDAYLLAASLYIHLSPVRERLSYGYEFKWSSWRNYVQKVPHGGLVDPHTILALLEGEISRSRKTYKMLLRDSIILERGEHSEDAKAINQFRGILVSNFPDLFKRIFDNNLENDGDYELELKIAEIKKKKRLVNENERTDIRYIINCLQKKGYSITEIASRLDMSRPVIYKYMNGVA